ncbi:SGNH/GDSL hydrolase family protein [Verrucomicrobiota bacterium]
MKLKIILFVFISVMLSNSMGQQAEESNDMKLDEHDELYMQITQKKGQGGFRKDLPQLFSCGDSISGGYAPFLRQALSDKVSYVYSLDLDRLFPQMKRPEKKKALGGTGAWFTPFVTAVLEYELYKPDVLLINFGLHNIQRCKAHDRIPRYERELNEMIKMVKGYPVKLVWVQTTQKTSGHEHNEWVRKFNEISLRVMTENKMDVIDLHAFTMALIEKHGESKVMRTDGVHFTPFGYEEQGKFLAKEVIRILNLK